MLYEAPTASIDGMLVLGMCIFCDPCALLKADPSGIYGLVELNELLALFQLICILNWSKQGVLLPGESGLQEYCQYWCAGCVCELALPYAQDSGGVCTLLPWLCCDSIPGALVIYQEMISLLVRRQC